MDWLTTIVRGLAKPLKWWVVIAVWERGLRVRLGKNPKELLPGLHFRIPWLDRIYVQSVRHRTTTTRNINATTKDGKSVVVSIAIHFAVADVLKVYDSLSSPETTISSIAEASVVEEVKGRSLEDCDGLAAAASAAINDNDWGLGEVTVKIIGFTVCRAYRLLQGDSAYGAGLGWLDDGGERK